MVRRFRFFQQTGSLIENIIPNYRSKNLFIYLFIYFGGATNGKKNSFADRSRRTKSIDLIFWKKELNLFTVYNFMSVWV
jgi:hypothetical protein